MMKILMINQPLNNRGDESAHKALLRAICKEYPKANIKVLFLGANLDSMRQFNVQLPYVEYLNLCPRRLMGCISVWGMIYGVKWLWHLHPSIRKCMKLYGWADMILCAPGGICLGGFQNWQHLFMLQLAKYMNKPLVYYGRSFGPFPIETSRNKAFKKLSIEILHYFSFLSIRDKKTESLATELGVRYVSTVDSAFLDSPKVDIPTEIKKAIGDNRYIVFVPNQFNWHYVYKKVRTETVISFFSQMANDIMDLYPNHKIVMLPQTFNNFYPDVKIFKSIQMHNGSSGITVIDDCYSSDVQQIIISQADLVVGARYHSIVFAINNNVPFISLSYEHKMSGLLETLSVSNSMLDITHIFEDKTLTETALKDFHTLLTNISLNPGIQHRAKEIATECFDKFKNYISNNY